MAHTKKELNRTLEVIEMANRLRNVQL